jgi:hypothetical protein
MRPPLPCELETKKLCCVKIGRDELAFGSDGARLRTEAAADAAAASNEQGRRREWWLPF